MGGESSCDPSAITNVNSRSFFEAVNKTYSALPENVKKSKNVEKVVKMFYDSLKHIPSTELEMGFIISGSGTGCAFLDNFVYKLSFPKTLTKISLRKSGLKSENAKQIAQLLINLPQLKQFDASENEFGKNANLIIRAATGHPSLISLQLEECKIPNDNVEDIRNLIKFSRKLETLRLQPLKLNQASNDNLSTDVSRNNHLTNISLCSNLDSVTAAVSDRNSFIYEFVDSIARSPFQRQFRTKVDAFKSVKGREMLMGRAKQKEKAKGTDLFSQMDEVDERARTTEAIETVDKIGRFRSGHAEMIGRRPNMEDVSIILPDSPTEKASLFGLFDGHGGREAAEFASQNLPGLIGELLKRDPSQPEQAYVSAFQRLQRDMRPWCVYVGCTACIAVIENTTLTVANIGDTRCVLCRDGKAIRLTVDHKPNLPEETAYIQSKGGFVRDERVGGMLAVSRSFGDGFLGESVNSTPHFVQEQLTAQDQFIILACDGVWDVISDQEACDIVISEIDPLTAAKKLRDRAFELESTDNISVIVVSLSELAFS